MTLNVSRVIASAIVIFVTGALAGQQPRILTVQPPKSFDTPHQAAQELIQAAAAYNVAALRSILGADGEDLFSSTDPVRDKFLAASFAAIAREKNRVASDPRHPNWATLVIGSEEWPFPVPLMMRNGKWIFHAKAGRAEILYRRIGGNELNAIQVCRGYVEAQREYAAQSHDGSGIQQYAERIISTPGKEDGLYWIKADGTKRGSISEGIARAIQEGYNSEKGQYHGYYFKILKGQGPAAPLGRIDYVLPGVMVVGFALVAVPSEYRKTGVKTFMVSNNGIVYEKDLGPKSLDLVKNMDLYNPDRTWRRVDDRRPVRTLPKSIAATNLKQR